LFKDGSQYFKQCQLNQKKFGTKRRSDNGYAGETANGTKRRSDNGYAGETANGTKRRSDNGYAGETANGTKRRSDNGYAGETANGNIISEVTSTLAIANYFLLSFTKY
jgi:hypothetical protein